MCRTFRDITQKTCSCTKRLLLVVGIKIGYGGDFHTNACQILYITDISSMKKQISCERNTDFSKRIQSGDFFYKLHVHEDLTNSHCY